MDFLGQVWKKDRWAFSAKLPLVYRLVRHYWLLDDMRRVRQNFHVPREAPRPQIWFQGRIQYLDPPPTAAGSINPVGLFLAESLCICVSLVNADKNTLLTLLTLSAGSLMLQSWRLLFMLCPIREWNRCRSQLGVISLSSRKACFT